MQGQDGLDLNIHTHPCPKKLLLQQLQSATSGNPHQVQTATKQLQAWETKKGFYPLVQDIAIDKLLPTETRYLAAIQLRIGIDKYWRNKTTNAVDTGDKAFIRSRLLESCVNEAHQSIALQHALVISVVARVDFPHHWPDVIDQVIDLLRQSSSPDANPIHLLRTLLALYRIIKEISTGRIPRLRSAIRSIAPEIFHVVGQIYVDKTQRWLALLQDGTRDEGGLLESMRQGLLAMKIVRRVLASGIESPHRDSDVRQFWGIIREHLGVFYTAVCQETHIHSPALTCVTETHLIQLAKMHFELVTTNPAAFVLLPDSVNIAKAYWGMVAEYGKTFGAHQASFNGETGTDCDADDDGKPIMERLCLKIMLIMRACVKMVYNPAQTFKYHHEREKQEEAEAMQLVKQGLLTGDFVFEMMQTIVGRYFILRSRDLRDWEEIPDKWEADEEGAGDDIQNSIKACAERLFLDLAIHIKSLTKPLLQEFYSVASPETEAIIAKCSIYTAVGLAAPVLVQEVDFDGFIRSTLVVEVRKQRPGYNLLRRRIALLLGSWITVGISDESKPIVYQIFEHLLNKDDPLNDRVVRVTAGRQLRSLAEDWHFKINDFMPYASGVLNRLMDLVSEVEHAATKMALLDTIGSLVECLAHHITPYADGIVSMLSPLWHQSEHEYLMKQAIVRILTRLINAMKAESAPLHSMVIPIIRNTLEPDSDAHLYLLEDTLHLWHSVLIQTRAPASADMLSLTSYLIIILDLANDCLPKCLEIAETYLLLAPADMYSEGLRTQLFKSFSSLLVTVRPPLSSLVTRLVEIYIRVADHFGGESTVERLAADMIRSGLFTNLIDGLKGAWEVHQKTGPNARAPAIDGRTETDYWTVVARLGLASNRVLLRAIEATQAGSSVVGMQDAPATHNAHMTWLLEEWFDHIDNIAAPTSKKLMCLALTKLLDTGESWILIKLQDLMTMWTSIVIELTQGNADPLVDCLVWLRQADPQEGPEAPDSIRQREMLYIDPVHTINILPLIKDHLHRAIVASGGYDRFKYEWLANVDRDVLEAFQKLDIM